MTLILKACRAIVDSVIAEFASPVEAVRCTVEIQQNLKTQNVELPDDRKMHFHIGVNLGDVMVDGDNLLGDGVNVAARLEALAEPGGICVSRAVRDQIRDKLNNPMSESNHSAALMHIGELDERTTP